ncbi:hypothetical protein KHO57_gp089 [Mycobacterium phage Phabba]|uniref:Uncharacterized protein n=1 Tax=Mycobacterium phage Phabba TaxID=2027899 RepID=A0A249XSU2_9CAUD|nr:hypothetical protein KHO57_gp089 [Mycobacterium phage Phabba]ASZ74815.1 hypothetical protein SEA_PHABBA_278 [Mycobacterium phage Phabba]
MSQPIFKGLPHTMELIKQEINAYMADVGPMTEDDLMAKLTELVRRYGNEQVTVTMAMNTAAQESNFSSSMGIFQQQKGSYERALEREYREQLTDRQVIEKIFAPGHTVTVTDIPPTNNRGARA